jgi:hypothetical protein
LPAVVVEDAPLQPVVVSHVTVAPAIGLLFVASFTVPVTVVFPAALYGPTNGPPFPVGGAPTG